MKIALDAMGGDYAPHELVLGAVAAAESMGVNVTLVGMPEVLEAELAGMSYPADLISIHPASQVVEMDESPALALRRKKDSSIVVATKLVRDKVCDAVVSCGSTGAQMAAALFILGRFGDIERPSISTLIPHDGTYTVLVDAGANVDARASQLVQFARMGRSYAQVVLGEANPRIGLLCNGTEEGKGNAAVVEAHELLKGLPDLNFVGNVEGRDVFTDRAHVVVCDGFAGNILLKSLEGMAIYLTRALVKKLGPEGAAILKEFDYAEIGGAPLLGINGVSIVCHGSSRARAVEQGIRAARQCVEQNLVERIQKAIEG